MKSNITITKLSTGSYVMNYSGRYGGGGTMHIQSAEEAACRLAWAIARYIDTNPEGGDYTAPPEVLDAMAAINTPKRGARISYYASPEALIAIQAEREATGASQSSAINALVLAGADATRSKNES